MPLSLRSGPRAAFLLAITLALTCLIGRPHTVSAQADFDQEATEGQEGVAGQEGEAATAASSQHIGHHHLASAAQHDPVQRAELREEFSDWFQDNEWLQHYTVDFQRIKMWRRITTMADADAVCNDGTPGVFYVRPGQGQGSKRCVGHRFCFLRLVCCFPDGLHPIWALQGTAPLEAIWQGQLGGGVGGQLKDVQQSSAIAQFAI